MQASSFLPDNPGYHLAFLPPASHQRWELEEERVGQAASERSRIRPSEKQVVAKDPCSPFLTFSSCLKDENAHDTKARPFLCSFYPTLNLPGQGQKPEAEGQRDKFVL